MFSKKTSGTISLILVVWSMARLLVRAVPTEKHPTDDKINVGQFQTGDVVTMIEDDQEWCPGDLGPWHETVEVPGVKIADLMFLSAPEVKTTIKIDPETLIPIATVELLQLRQWKAKNLSALKLVSGLVAVPKGQEVTFASTYFDHTLKEKTKAVSAGGVKADGQ